VAVKTLLSVVLSVFGNVVSLKLMSVLIKLVVVLDEVNFKFMGEILVAELVLNDGDVISMVGVGRTKSTSVPPKNVCGVVEGEAKPNLLSMIATLRFTEVDLKASIPIEVTLLGMFIDVKLLQNLKAKSPINVTVSGIMIDVKLLQL
jgi:hypothetical protein